jgi:hypothetical protein
MFSQIQSSLRDSLNFDSIPGTQVPGYYQSSLRDFSNSFLQKIPAAA